MTQNLYKGVQKSVKISGFVSTARYAFVLTNDFLLVSILKPLDYALPTIVSINIYAKRIIPMKKVASELFTPKRPLITQSVIQLFQ